MLRYAFVVFVGTRSLTQPLDNPYGRHGQGVLDLHPNWQALAGEVRAVLREAHTAVEEARARGETRLDPALLAELRAR
jgi:hypothetical protein